MIGAQSRGGLLPQSRTVELLEQVLARLDRLEARVEGLAAGAAQLPAALAAVTDTLDDAAARLDRQGASLDARLGAGRILVDKLTRPGTLEALARAVDRIEALEPMLGALEQLPGLAALATDWFDELARGAAAAGLDLDARLRGLRDLVLALTEPAVMDGLTGLLPLLPKLAPLAAHAEALPGLVALGVDAFDDWLRQQMDAGLDPEQLLQSLLTVGARVTALLDSAEFKALMDSGVLSPRAVGVVGQAAAALSSGSTRGPERLGPFGLLRALRDPDLQRTLGFAVRFARGFGRQIDPSAAPALLTGPSGAKP